MYRIVSVILAVAALAMLIPASPAAPPDGLKLGEDFKGRCSGENLFIPVARAGGQVRNPAAGLGTNEDWIKGYMGKVPVVLKAGQGIDVSVTVTGEKRQVFLKVLDPDGKQIARSKAIGLKTERLSIEEVNASGTFTIVVISDQIGGFTLRAKGMPDDEADADKLKEKIKRYEQDLADLKAKLKAIQEK